MVVMGDDGIPVRTPGASEEGGGGVGAAAGVGNGGRDDGFLDKATDFLFASSAPASGGESVESSRAGVDFERL